MTVLRLEVWLSIVGALTVTGIMIWILDKYSPYSAQNNKSLYPYPCRYNIIFIIYSLVRLLKLGNVFYVNQNLNFKVATFRIHVTVFGLYFALCETISENQS